MPLPAPAARRYARALYAQAVQEQAAAAVQADLAMVGRELAASPDLRRFAGDYLISRSARARTLTALFASRVHGLTWRFLRFVETKQRLGLLAGIAQAYAADDEYRRGVVRGTLTSAVALDEDRVTAIAARTSARLGRAVRLSARVDDALLGGFSLRVGDTVYDYSLAARLRLARAALAEGQG
jgi:F-type H+-transporting ATPase subunit delta